MVAPIITFVVAAGVGFLAWQTSTVEPYLDDSNPLAAEEAAAAADADEPMADDEPAADEESE